MRSISVILCVLLFFSFYVVADALQPPELQPISFQSKAELFSFIASPQEKLSVYSGTKKEYFTKLCEEITSKGEIPYLKCLSEEVEEKHVSLYPRAKYEDAGLCYHTFYKGEDVRVIISCIDKEYAKNASLTMESYIGERFDFSDDKTVKTVQNVNGIFSGVPIYMDWKDKDAQDCIWGLLNDDYYIVIRSALSCEDMLVFLDGIAIEKVDIGSREETINNDKNELQSTTDNNKDKMRGNIIGYALLFVGVVFGGLLFLAIPTVRKRKGL